MAASLNKVQIIGHLGKDPEVKSFSNGGKIVNLTVATSESWRDKSTGERKERTEWHSVKIQNEGAAKFAEQYLRKGSKVYVEGALCTRKWQDQSGNDRYTTEIIVAPYSGEVMSLDKRDSGGGDQGRDDQGQGDQGRSVGDRAQGGGNHGQSNRRPARDIDDEIPF